MIDYRSENLVPWKIKARWYLLNCTRVWQVTPTGLKHLEQGYRILILIASLV